MKKSLQPLLLLFVLILWCQPVYNQAPARATVTTKAEKFLRTELYFGRSRPDGTVVTDDEWNEFVAEVVTTRFPGGFTILNGIGHFRDISGKIIVERSSVLILLYPRRKRTESRTRIEEIRAVYVKKFDQESVLRMDLSRSVLVSF